MKKVETWAVTYWEENMGTQLAMFHSKGEAEAYCEGLNWEYNGNKLNIVKCKPLPACCFK